MEVRISIKDAFEIDVISAAMREIAQRRMGLLPLAATATVDEIADAIEAADERNVGDEIISGLQEAIEYETAIDPPTEQEAVDVARRAIEAGHLAYLIAFLADKKVKRVPDLTPADRAELVRGLALKLAAEGGD